MLEARAVSIALGGAEIIKKISFRVAAGEFFVIIGPNGSGKTTLLKGMSATAPLAAGEIRIKKRPLTAFSRRELARTIALVPQQMPQDFPFTVTETVLMGRSPHLGLLGIETGKDHGIAARAMDTTGVSHLGGRRLGELSGGELQRTVIARALCQEPEILILDEPTASLDPAHQTRIMDILARLRHEQGMTVIMVSHDLNLAAMYADRVLVLEKGRARACGASAEVMTAELLEQVYGCRMLVERVGESGLLTAIPLPGQHL